MERPQHTASERAKPEVKFRRPRICKRVGDDPQPSNKFNGPLRGWGGGVWGDGAGASPAPAATHTAPPVPMPQVVNPDGTLNMSVLNNMPVAEPPGYTGPKQTAGDLARQRDATANLTPAEIVAMTPAQRKAAGVVDAAPGQQK